MRVEHDRQLLGLFERGTWLRLIEEAGLTPMTADIPDPYEGEHAVFIAVKQRGGLIMASRLSQRSSRTAAIAPSA
ncbi:MAG: hypothetical protein HC850_14245, partial [Rhodomicrobium sp.]|nr:hypothetical protein [Rhodomicrobium sp.]